MHSYNCCLLYKDLVFSWLKIKNKRGGAPGSSRPFHSTKLCEPGDDQVPNLLVVGVAGHEEHVPGDALDEHLLPSDSVGA